jgi:hypothetical protein
MPSREFVDSRRIAWTVWHVTVTRSERRQRATRRGEERSNSDRRHVESKPRRLRIHPRLAAGWLCFECATEKRRLVPVPPGWQRMSERGLEELCARAIAMPKTAALYVTPRRRPATAPNARVVWLAR